MLRNLPRKAAFGLLASLFFLFTPVIAYAITWTNLGQIGCQQARFFCPTASGFWGGYTELSSYRYIYASHDTFTYGSRVADIQYHHNDSGGLEYPALDFDEAAQNGSQRPALDATTWYQTNAPVFDYWRYDDNGDGRREQVRLAFIPPQLNSSAHYYYDQQYEDLDFPYYSNSGLISTSAYWIWSWGSRIDNEWMCTLFYETNNTFSRQC